MSPVSGLARLSTLLRLSEPGQPVWRAPFLDEVRTWLLEFDLNRFLATFRWSQELKAFTTGKMHLGFVVYPALLAGWSERLEKAGFRAEEPFLSQVLAREMSLWRGGEALSCWVWRGWCTEDRGLECFFPDLPDSEVDCWIVEGRGRHLGLELKRPEQLDRALQCCLQGGFQVPEFLAGQPARNGLQKIQLVYADGEWEGCPLRLEFYACDARCSANA